MEPQQRLLLEIAWEAFEVPGGLWCSWPRLTGVFISLEVRRRLFLAAVRPQARWIHSQPQARPQHRVGTAFHVFDLRDRTQFGTACSSSLVAVHLACQNLRPVNVRWPWPAART
jgi:acyl transferase domain-containing protein